MCCFCENPIAKVTTDPVGDAKPSAKLAVREGKSVTGYMVPNAVIKRKISPFGDIRCVSGKLFETGSIVIVPTDAAHQFCLVH
jgi:hypothetical protein